MAKRTPKQKAIKVPSLFKKQYTKKSLDKKIYKKIFIEDDKKFLKGFISQTGKKGKKEIPLYSIPNDLTVTAKDQKRLVLIAKSIKKQKGRFKLLPLFAVIIFLVMAGTAITLTKNFICRKIITSSCESIFEAKCDIEYLNLKFLSSSFTMKNFEVADKNNPMKDLFSIENLNIDFSFPQLLRAHFVAEDLTVLGIETGKERKYSGDLTAQRLAKIEKKKAKKAAKEAKKAQSTPVMESLKEKIAATTNEEITALFNQYNPKTIIDNCYSNLQTPAVSQEVKEAVEKINKEWKETPQTISAKVESTRTSVNDAVNYDFSTIKNNPVKIQEAIETINKAITEVNSLKEETTKVVDNFKTSADQVSSLSQQITDAIKHDKNLASEEISKITSFKLSDTKNIISGYFNKLGYSLLGKYYPYAYKAINKLLEIKNSSYQSPKKTKKAKTKAVAGSRQSGRDVYFKGDTTPRFWIKKAQGSGKGITISASNISTDQDALGKPAQADFIMNRAGIDHKAKVVVDCRSNSNEALISADYSCSSLPLLIPSSYFGDGNGVPSFDTKGNLSFNASVYGTEGFTLNGNGNFSDLKITTNPFEPEYASKIYSSVLSKINQMTLGVTGGYTEKDGLILQISSDADKKFASAFSSEMNAQLDQVKKSVESELTAKINEYSKGALGEISSFEDIKNKINDSKNSLNSLSEQLEAKKKEATKMLTDSASSKLDEAKTKAGEAAASKLKGLFGN